MRAHRITLCRDARLVPYGSTSDGEGDGPGLDPAAWSLKNFVEATPSSMAMFDTGIRYLAVSPQFLIDNKIAETQQTIVGRSVFEFRRDSTEAREVNRRVLSGETIVKE